MTDDLERRLRSERGPRDRGYVPTALPRSMPLAGGRPGAGLRATLIAATAAAAVVVVAVAAGLWRSDGVAGGVDPSTAIATATESALSQSSTPSATVAPCTPDDLAFAAGPWTGAAGSRGTSVTVTLAPGAPVCTSGVGVAGRVLDANGRTLVEYVPTLVHLPLVTWVAGDSRTIGVAWSNWCDAIPDASLILEVRLTSWATWVSVEAGVSGADRVPPCLGTGGTHLSVTELQLGP